MKQTSNITTALKLALVSVVALQVACSTSTSSTPPPADVSISGIITAAPISGANVSVIDVDGTVVVEPVPTDAAGRYSLVIPGANLAQDLIVKSSGGGFIDEATTQDGIAGDMFAYVSADSLSSGSSVSVTPGSTIVADLVMNHKKSLTEAETAFFSGFGYTPDIAVTPVDATVVALDASDESKLAGLRAAAFSQLALDLDLSHNDQFIMFTALAQDLSDGMLNGLMAGAIVEIDSPTVGIKPLPTDILKRSADALLDFQVSDKSKMNLTSLYQIDYLQGSMSSKAGKSTFTFHITDRSTDNPETGLMPKVMPLMNMAADHTHSTPLSVVTNDGGGSYTANIYYVMPSAMNGMSMGYWDLGVEVENESVHFYPNVMMSMGDTALVKLKGVEDKIMSMMTGSMESRTYFIFKDELTENLAGGAGSYDFSMFIAAQEDMMSFPTLVTNLVLNEGEMNELAVDCLNIAVSVSTDDGASWSSATSGCTDGLWTIGLTLKDGMAESNDVRVKLTVDSEVKTTDGLEQEADVNDYQTFTLTPNPGMSM